MVSHQDSCSVRTGKCAHAIMLARHDETIIHRIACNGDDLIGEPLGEIDHCCRVWL